MEEEGSACVCRLSDSRHPATGDPIRPSNLVGLGASLRRHIVFQFHRSGYAFRMGPRDRQVPGGWETRVIPDEYLLAPEGTAGPVRRTFRVGPTLVPAIMTVRVWDVGKGGSDSVAVAYSPNAGVADRARAPELVLSRSRPNPSSDWVAWEVRRQAEGEVNLRVVAVDGRAVRSWPEQTIPAGVTRILWDGRDDRGMRAASGRYFLVVTDRAGMCGATPRHSFDRRSSGVVVRPARSGPDARPSGGAMRTLGLLVHQMAEDNRNGLCPRDSRPWRSRGRLARRSDGCLRCIRRCRPRSMRVKGRHGPPEPRHVSRSRQPRHRAGRQGPGDHIQRRPGADHHRLRASRAGVPGASG